MAKVCDINGETIGMLARLYKLRDGVICYECALKSGYPLDNIKNIQVSSTELKQKNIQEIKQEILTINIDKKEIKKNSIYKGIPGSNMFVYLNNENKFAMFGKLGYYKYSDVESVDLIVEIEDKNSKGAMGAAVGTVILPVVGTIIGGLARHGVDKSKVKAVGVKIKAKGHTLHLKTWTGTAKKSKLNNGLSLLNIYIAQAESIENALKKIIKNNENAIETVNGHKNDYSELYKLKELLDNGVITQEEFDKKKKEILD